MNPRRDDQRVDQQIDQSFPASDPPSFTPSTATPSTRHDGLSEPTTTPAAAAVAHKLDGLLRSEIASAEAYQIATEHLDGGGGRVKTRLERMLSEHGESIAELARDARELGVPPPTASGAIGFIARNRQRAASVFGERAMLRALRAGEVRSQRRYERALGDDSLPPRIRQQIRDGLIPRQREHLAVLDDLLTKA